MKQLFFHELKQSVTKYFFKKCFHGENPEKGEKSTFINVLLSIKIFFCNCASIFNINNSFSIKIIKCHILKILTTWATLRVHMFKPGDSSNQGSNRQKTQQKIPW